LEKSKRDFTLKDWNKFIYYLFIFKLIQLFFN
jgi:hypothetical protein